MFHCLLLGVHLYHNLISKGNLEGIMRQTIFASINHKFGKIIAVDTVSLKKHIKKVNQSIAA